jgi:hypothetical protein
VLPQLDALDKAYPDATNIFFVGLFSDGICFQSPRLGDRYIVLVDLSSPHIAQFSTGWVYEVQVEKQGARASACNCRLLTSRHRNVKIRSFETELTRERVEKLFKD